MDAQKFGAFIASIRKEKNMTQAELAQKIRVTDKAVSRWERGLGFPDINTLEPLAEALGISVLELMRSEKLAEPIITNEEASESHPLMWRKRTANNLHAMPSRKWQYLQSFWWGLSVCI
jgi:transcriptional regulator with XRE-family HTH domain